MALDTLWPIESLDELTDIPVGNKVVLVHKGITSEHSYTVHGEWLGVSGSHATVRNHIEIGNEFTFDSENPDLFLDYLDGLQEPLRKTAPSVYKGFVPPADFYLVYHVVENKFD